MKWDNLSSNIITPQASELICWFHYFWFMEKWFSDTLLDQIFCLYTDEEQNEILNKTVEDEQVKWTVKKLRNN